MLALFGGVAHCKVYITDSIITLSSIYIFVLLFTAMTSCFAKYFKAVTLGKTY